MGIHLDLTRAGSVFFFAFLALQWQYAPFQTLEGRRGPQRKRLRAARGLLQQERGAKFASQRSDGLGWTETMRFLRKGTISLFEITRMYTQFVMMSDQPCMAGDSEFKASKQC